VNAKPDISPPAEVDRTDLALQIERATNDYEVPVRDLETGFDAVLNRVVEAAGAGVLFAMTGLVFINAGARYIFNFSLAWSDEIVISLIPWLAMTGLFLSARRREIIRIEHFVARFPPRVRRLLNAFAELVSAVLFAYLCYLTVEYLSFFGGDRTVYLALPQWWFHSAVLVGSSMLVIAFLVDMAKTARTGDTGASQ
jgi:TRAP-type C4-dicarboxylate transport system permease small subunit